MVETKKLADPGYGYCQDTCRPSGPWIPKKSHTQNEELAASSPWESIMSRHGHKRKHNKKKGNGKRDTDTVTEKNIMA